MGKINLAIVAVLISLYGIGKPIRSNVMGKEIEYLATEDWEPTAADYIQDGLVAMWDGIENAEWGVHDPNATTWKDLVGGVLLSRAIGLMTVALDHLNLSNAGLRGDIPGFGDILASHEFTFQVLLRSNSDSSNPVAALLTSGVGRPGINGPNSKSGVSQYGTLNAGAWSTGIDAPYGTITSATYVANAVGDSGTEARLYNGTKQTTVYARDPDVFPTYSNPNRISIGIAPFQKQQIAVDMDYFCVRLYSRALTAAEIAHNYAIDRLRFNLP